MMRALAHVLPAIVLLLLQGCVIDSVPTPEETDSHIPGVNPGPNGAGGQTGSDALHHLDPASLFYSRNGSGPAVRIVGLPGIAPGAGLIGAQNARLQAWSTHPVAADRSFWVTIDADLADDIYLVYFQQQSAQIIADAHVVMAPSSVAAIGASLDLGSAANPASGSPTLTVSSPDAQGVVTVTGASGIVAPGVTIVISSESGSATGVEASLDGGFTAHLAARTGDSIVLFATEPAASHAGGPFTTLVVPLL